MSEEFYELTDFGEVAHPDLLVLRRAQALAAAVRDAADYTLVQLLSRGMPGAEQIEALVVDIECDGVPSRNPVGIQYRERLALLVPEDQAALVEVIALRKSFPVLMHQNHGTRDGAASICLYFEPTPTVMRTWTPQRFLRRIQWWLEQSAKGELHPADQPVEHLFFASKYELVLPWNLDALRSAGGAKMAVVRSQARPDGGGTFFLKPVGDGHNVPPSLASHIELTLPSVVQGFVERDPATLGDLADLLARRGVDLLPRLIAALSDGVGSAGVPAGSSDSFAVIILHIPMVREAGGEVQRVARRAFLVQGDLRQLGVKAGALYLHDKRYFAEVQGSVLARDPATEWKSEPIFPMDVLQFPDSSAARKQSSLGDEGPRGVLVGAGSLGSAMLNLWTRAGWGKWSVIDKDHIKPHNLARHVAFAQHVGELKCDVVAELSWAATEGAATVTSVRGDACDLGALAVQDTLTSANLVVDASAALEYPRQASFQDNLPRHATSFVTPNGNGAVLMMEDQGRTTRLRTLEAQYYRALIRQAWGAKHLEGNLGTYWSGASCRDISVAMPYSRIAVHASTLAEQVMLRGRSEEACIRVWDREPETGRVSVHDVHPATERRLDFGDLSVFYDEGLATHLKSLRLATLPKETGGVLLGYHDFNVGAIVLVDALPAPPDSRASAGTFERGTAGLVQAVQEASARTAGIVGYVGEWHSHPPGHSAMPSRDDLVQLAEISLGMHGDGLPALQLIVSENDIQVMQGRVQP
ncbi:ThiF family adenylyltransferase [Pseudogulbenkiania subflava]|uniref:JAB domain-containing protein n=1 Tax=Pseudogulbenkiania subflava DSM 22618 TaxID=1123014 RepID=A0A1Y6BPC6_9NEIS|nr:ThiF family adenylyltransferase [Pseudogulbenkiania subflava]SMF13925.1 JAB domain-containing protein [Pseudogulbenkiania subflava DSM 22618]